MLSPIDSINELVEQRKYEIINLPVFIVHTIVCYTKGIKMKEQYIN